MHRKLGGIEDYGSDTRDASRHYLIRQDEDSEGKGIEKQSQGDIDIILDLQVYGATIHDFLFYNYVYYSLGHDDYLYHLLAIHIFGGALVGKYLTLYVCIGGIGGKLLLETGLAIE